MTTKHENGNGGVSEQPVERGKNLARLRPGWKFHPGLIVGTAAVRETVGEHDANAALHRHLHGDWGDVGRGGWDANEAALIEGSRLFSVYHDRNRTRFWIITESDRSQTTILLPDEY